MLFAAAIDRAGFQAGLDEEGGTAVWAVAFPMQQDRRLPVGLGMGCAVDQHIALAFKHQDSANFRAAGKGNPMHNLELCRTTV